MDAVIFVNKHTPRLSASHLVFVVTEYVLSLQNTLIYSTVPEALKLVELKILTFGYDIIIDFYYYFLLFWHFGDTPCLFKWVSVFTFL